MKEVVPDVVRRFCVTFHSAIILLDYRIDAFITIYFVDM